MARFWNLRRNIDRISLDICDLIDNIHRNLRVDNFLNETFRAEVMNDLASVDILEHLRKCNTTIDLMDDVKRVLKMESKRRELEESVSFMYNTFV